MSGTPVTSSRSTYRPSSETPPSRADDSRPVRRVLSPPCLGPSDESEWLVDTQDECEFAPSTFSDERLMSVKDLSHLALAAAVSFFSSCEGASSSRPVMTASAHLPVERPSRAGTRHQGGIRGRQGASVALVIDHNTSSQEKYEPSRAITSHQGPSRAITSKSHQKPSGAIKSHLLTWSAPCGRRAVGPSC